MVLYANGEMRSGACGNSFPVAWLFPVKYEARSSAKSEDEAGGPGGLLRDEKVCNTHVKERESESSRVAWEH